MANAFVALGANLGDRAAQLNAAVQALEALPNVAVKSVSSVHETTPVGGPPGSPHFLNAAAHLETGLDPAQLLHHLLQIEHTLGRVRSTPDAPRTIDLDIVLFDEVVNEQSDPLIPHPRMHRRRFVLAPLAEIAPQALHPVLKRSVLDLLNRLAEPHRTKLGGLRALVTGSTSGIGLETARRLAMNGADVIVHGYRSHEAVRRVASELAEFGVMTETRMADLRDRSAVDGLAQSSWNLWNGLDILVCNAGADTLTGEAAQWPFDDKLQCLWQVDVQSTIRLARNIGQRMKDAGQGVILTMGWDQAETGMEGDSGELFATAKGAVMAFSRSLAKSLAPVVRVNSLAPGWIKTAWGSGASEDWHNRVLRETPMKRWGTPADVADAAAWLASPAASFVTGQIVRINGGAV